MKQLVAGHAEESVGSDRGTSESEDRVPSRSTEARTREREAVPWFGWQATLYLLALGAVCILLAPLTSFWWVVPVLGMAGPLVLVLLDRTERLRKGPDDRKLKERELLEALAELGEITPAAAAMKTSLTVDEAQKMLGDLAGKGHLKPRAEEGGVVYSLRGRDRHEPPQAGRPPQALDEPLSERELEVLNLLALGRTNSEVARELFISLGTVKSHTGNIYRKLGAKNRAEALARARALNLIP
jgi:DNA-binding CsgD family transcriptional regulator